MQKPDSSSVEYKRRAVFTGLKGFLDHDALMRSLCLWQRDYSDKPKFAISRFISHLVENYQLHNKRRELQITMARMLMEPAAKLDEDPLPMMRLYAASHRLPCDLQQASIQPPAQPTESSDNRLFRLFLEALENRLVKTAAGLPEKLHDSLKARMFRLDLAMPEQKQLELWLNDRQKPLTVAIGKPSLHELLNAVYVWLCQELGPVEADRLFGQAVATVERNPDVAGQSPRSLL